jgi:Xaa-Pro aminopeptidase
MTLIQHTKLADTEYTDRLARVRSAMADRNIVCGIAYANEFVPGDVQYLTGYDPQIEAVSAIITPTEIALLGGPEGEAMFNDQGAVGRWFNFELFEVPFQDYGSLKFWTLDEVIAELGIDRADGVAILTEAKYIPYGVVSSFVSRGFEIAQHDDIIAGCRYAKSPLELEIFEASSRIATMATAAMLESLTPGMTELELAAIGDATMKRAGAYSYGWDTMVLSGDRINSVIGRASNKRISDGEFVLIGACPRYAGYCSTVGRTVVAGTASDDQKRFIERGARALAIAAEHLVEGAPAKLVDSEARAFLDGVDLARYHAYGVGHGIGFSECLELRTATSASDYLLPRGITMSLDIGIFGNPTGFNGRFEDPYVIDHEGVTRRLTDLPL